MWYKTSVDENILWTQWIRLLHRNAFDKESHKIKEMTKIRLRNFD